MSLVTRYSRSNVRASGLPQIQLDVARSLWSKSRFNVEADPENAFRQQLTDSDSNILEIDSNSIPNQICYRIVDDRCSIVLTPLALNNNFNIELRSLKINLPDGIRSNCLTMNQFTTQEDETGVLIDLISNAGMVITILLKLSDFVANNSNSTISSSNYSEWCKISNPYAFDIRKPHILYSISYDQSIVLLRDGGIIGLRKDPKTFDIEPMAFNDNSYFESLGHFFNPWSKQHKFSSKDSDLSPKTAIDVLHYGDYLITVAINKKLRIWSIPKQSLILEKELTELISNNKITTNKPFFDPNPTKVLDLLTVEVNGAQQTYLSTFLPFGSGYFKLFELTTNNDVIDVQDLGSKFEFEAVLPDSTTIWLVADFRLTKPTKSNEALELWVLWKSNTSSIIQNLKIQQDSTYQWYEVDDSPIELHKYTDSETWSEFYLRKIFESDIYSNEIVSTALAIYEHHFTTNNADNEDTLLDDLSIREKAVKTIGQSIIIDKNYDQNIKKQWSRFDTLCKEFQKQSDEPMKLHYDAKTDFIFLINRSEFSLIRKTSNIELLSNNKHLKISSIEEFDDIKDHLRFLNIISNFRNSISGDVLDSVRNALVRLVNNTTNSSQNIDNLAKIYSDHLDDKFNPSNLSNLIEELSLFDDIFKIIKELLGLQSSNPETQFLTKGKLTNFGVSLVLKSLKDVIKSNQEILFDLLVLLLVLEIYKKDELESILATILPKFKAYQTLETSFSVNFNGETNKLELDETSNLENGLVAKVLDDKFPTGVLLNDGNLNDFINGQIIPYITSSEFLYSISTYLISNDNSSLVYTQFSQYFDSSPIFKFLQAITFLKTNQTQKAEKLFLKNSQNFTKYVLTDSEKAILSSLEDFTVLFKSSLTKYYFNLAIIFLHDLKFQSALKFINLSIADNFNAEFDSEHLEEKYYVLFSIANDLSNFEVATRALDNIKDPKRKQEVFNSFIYGLYKNGETRVLNYFDFQNDYRLIDSILLKKAQSFPADLRKSLFFYQTLYAFRLKYKSYRGALESLYEFIYKFRSFIETDESVKLTISELYSTILNLLVTLPKDEQWLIYHLNDVENDVVSYEQLKEQQQRLISSFSRDLKLKYLS